MIAFQWRPPWRQLTAACKHSRSILKGKAPEGCICQQVPARHASMWAQLAFPSGEGASTSTSTSPEIGSLFFYPSFHFDIPRVKSRHVKLVRRALRRSLGLARSLSPIASTSAHQPIFYERKPPPRRHIAHSAIIQSAPSSYADLNPEGPPTFQDLHFSPPAKPVPKDRQRRRGSQRDTITATQTYPRLESPSLTASSESQQSKPDILPVTGIHTRAEAQSAIEVRQQSRTYLFDKLFARTVDLIEQRADLKRIRWRLYALLRIFKANFHITNIKSRQLQYLVGRVCDLHERLNDSNSIEKIIRRTEILSARYYTALVPRRAYHRLLRTYTRSLRSKEAYSLLRKIQTMDRIIGADTYLNFVTMYAHMKQPENARAVIETMRRDNIPVDQKAFASLMNAYVEAGLWDDAIDVFEYLDSHADRHPLKPDLYTCTTLMKCYILMGAPLDEIMNILQLMQSRGIELSRKTYVHLLHAACEAGALDFAEEVFARLDEEGKKWGANVVAFSIMIRAMLRAGRHDVANEYYQEMKRRNLQPTSATWSILLQAYASADKPETNAILSELLRQYLDVYMDTRTGNVRLTPYSEDTAVARGTALENVYGPVIASFAKSTRHSQPAGPPSEEGSTPSLSSEQAAVEMFKNMLAHPGSKPSLHLYSALLDAYRRVGNIAGVEELWPHIIEYATATLDKTPSGLVQHVEASSAVPPSKRNLLCLPLSIYMDAMSTHHLHHKVAEAWAQVQEMGFGFDIGNWNHLIAAFVRAGEIERGLWVAEELLRDAKNFRVNRYQDKHERVADTAPTSQAGTNGTPSEDAYPSILEGDKVETPMRPPNRTWQYHKRRKENIYAQQDDLTLPLEQAPTPSAQAQTDLASRQRTSLSVPIPKYAISEGMTASFDILRRQHNAQIWVLFESTTRLLEEALRQDDRLQSGSQDGTPVPEEAVDTSSKDDTILGVYASTHPLTMSTIEQYRAKMRRLGLRT